MAHVISRNYEEPWSGVFYKAAIAGLVLVGLAALYFVLSGPEPTVVADSALPPVVPPMFPVIPLL